MTRTRETKIQQLNVPGVDVEDTVQELPGVLLVVEAHCNPFPVLFEGLVWGLEGGLGPVSQAMSGVAKLLLSEYKHVI